MAENDKVGSAKQGEETKEARLKLPKDGAVGIDKSQKEARPKLPVKKVVRGIFGTIALLAYTALAIFLSNFIVVNLFVAILGMETASEPMWEGLIFALVYVLSVLLTIVIPPAAIRWYKAKSRNEQKKLSKSEKGVARESLGLRGWPTWADIGLAPVGYIVYFLLAMGAVAVFSNFPWFDAEEKQELVYETTVVGWDRIIAFVSYVVIAPIAEELIFRGWLYGKLRERFSVNLSRWGGMCLAIFLVSLLFALVHQNLVVGVCVFMLSVVLCSLREITGTIYAGILVHMIVNGVAFYQNYIAQM